MRSLIFDILGHEAARIERAVSMKTILIILNGETTRYDWPQDSIMVMDKSKSEGVRLVLRRPKEPQVVLEAEVIVATVEE